MDNLESINFTCLSDLNTTHFTFFSLDELFCDVAPVDAKTLHKCDVPGADLLFFQGVEHF